MATENRRREEILAETEDSGRNPVPPTNSAMVDEVEREQSILPDSRPYAYHPKIERVVSDYNIQTAIEAVVRNKGAPGIDGITTAELKKVMAMR